MPAGASLPRLARAAHGSLQQSMTGVATAMLGFRPYHKNVVEHYENPRNVGSFEKGDLNVGTGLVGAPACGDVMKLQIKVRLVYFERERFAMHLNVWLSLCAYSVPGGPACYL